MVKMMYNGIYIIYYNVEKKKKQYKINEAGMESKKTILEWYQKNHKFIDAPCGGRGECGRCRIKFLSDAPEPTVKEKKKLNADELAQGIRLACQTAENARHRAVLCGELSEYCRKTGEESDFAAVCYDKDNDWEENDEQKFAVALDIGTTTLAMRLIDLQSGKGIKTITAMNHQRIYGADVITRIQAANEGRLKELQMSIQQEICALLIRLSEEVQIRPAQIKKIAVVGNTTMCHLLLGYSCEGLGKAPFQPVSTGLTKIMATKLFERMKDDTEYTKEEHGIQMLLSDMKETEVIILPGISAFVGADIVAGMYYCDMDLKEDIQLLLDIGTNGEMVIGNKSAFTVTSTAAGPVFEGGNISCGMPAVKGAIAHIAKNQYEVVENAAAKGLCGSGLVDLTAYLLEEHLIDENGTLCDKYFEDGYPVGEICGRKLLNMKLTQTDIREIQMGKAAVRAGIEILACEKSPVQIYLAGGLGTAIDISSAIKIGLFPENCAGRVRTVGNSALEGAHKYLLDRYGEERISRIIQSSNEIFLSKRREFEETYIHFMQFLV